MNIIMHKEKKLEFDNEFSSKVRNLPKFPPLIIFSDNSIYVG